MAVAETPSLAPPAPEPAPARRPTAARVAVAVVLLLPVLAELLFRNAWEGQPPLVPFLPAVGLYAVACFLFAVLAPAAPAVDRPAEGEPRPRWPLFGLAAVALAGGVYVAIGNIRHPVLLGFWLVGIGAWVAAWARGIGRPSLTRRQWLAFGLVMLIAAGLRLYALESHQASHIDEFVSADIALSLARFDPTHPRGLPLFAMAPNDIGSQLLLGMYHRRGLFEWLGVSFTTHRLPSALYGILDVALVFFVGRALFGFRVGLVAALTIATLTAHLSFSRRGDPTIEGILVWSATSLFLIPAFARRSVRLMALAGVTLSLSLYLYLSSRPAIAFVLVALILACLDPRLRGRWLLKGMLALIAGFLVGAGPLLVTLYREPSVFTYHSVLTSWLGAAIEGFRRTGNIAELRPVWEHFWRAFLAYNVVPSAEHHYYPERGLFLPLPASFVYAGLALVCLRLRDWRHRLLALWFWAPTIALSALSDYPPPVHRLQPVFPAVAVMIALVYDRMLAAWSAVGRRARRAFGTVAAVAFGATLAAEAWFYYGDYSMRDHDYHQGGLARFILAQPPGEHLVFLTGAASGRFAINFATKLGERNSHEWMHRAVDALPELDDHPEGVTYVVNTAMLPWLSLLRDAYPNGAESVQRPLDSRVKESILWLGYAVEPAALARHRGLDLSVRDAAGAVHQLRAPAVVTPETLPEGLRYPLELEWRGWFQHQPFENRPIGVQSAGTVVPELRLGSALVDFAAQERGWTRLRPPPGGQPLHARARLERPGDRVEVLWESGRPDEGPAPFPRGRAATWPGQPRVTVDWLTADGAQLVRREYDVVMADHTVGSRTPRPGTPMLVRWTGSVQVPRDGLYGFETIGDQNHRLLVDGRQVWPPVANWRNPGDLRADQRVAQVRLTAGPHELVLERHHVAGGQTHVLWQRAGDPEPTIIPMDAFVPISWP